jgi:hypothetical protein
VYGFGVAPANFHCESLSNSRTIDRKFALARRRRQITEPGWINDVLCGFANILCNSAFPSHSSPGARGVITRLSGFLIARVHGFGRRFIFKNAYDVSSFGRTPEDVGEIKSPALSNCPQRRGVACR